MRRGTQPLLPSKMVARSHKTATLSPTIGASGFILNRPKQKVKPRQTCYNSFMSSTGGPHVVIVGAVWEGSMPRRHSGGIISRSIRHAAKSILRACAGLPLEPFHYWDKGI
jgi:hypothetical protein